MEILSTLLFRPGETGILESVAWRAFVYDERARNRKCVYLYLSFLLRKCSEKYTFTNQL